MRRKMADAKKCDVCGKFYNIYSEVEIKDVGTFVGCKLLFTNAYANTRYMNLDLCSDCMIKVHSLLNDIAKDAEKE